MNILYSTSRDSDEDGALGMPIIAYNYQGDGIETTYKYSDNKQFTQKILVYSKTNGYLTNFTINQDSGQIIFATPPANGEIFNVTSFGVTGDKMIFDYQTGIGSTTNEINVPIAYNQIDGKQILIFVNNFIAPKRNNIQDGTQTKLTFGGNLVSGDTVQTYVFDVASTANRTFSIVTVDTFTVNDSTRTFTLSDGSDFDLSRTDKVIVELNDNRLRPPVFCVHLLY